MTLALPMLEALAPRSARAAAAPRRFLTWASPNGTVVDRWVCKPGDDPSDFMLSEILQPLERHKRDLVVLQNLHQHGGHGHHYIAALTGRPVTDRGYPRLWSQGISLDQYVARKLAGTTPLPSLELGVGVVDGRDGISSISWSAAARPVPPENNPFKLYARLFTDGSKGAATQLGRVVSSRRSIIDAVLSQVGGVSRQVGTADRAVLDNYLESLRSMERQMAALAARQGRCPVPGMHDEPPGTGTKPWWLITENHPAVLRLQMQIAIAAFACDLTRVITLTVANAGGYYRYLPWIAGLPRAFDWHALSHMVEKGEEQPLVNVERWLTGELAHLIDGLKAVTDADGDTLLANTLVLATNEYGPNGPVRYVSEKNNWTHFARMMPYLLIGRAGGGLRTGRNLVYPLKSDGKGIPHTRLLVSILNALGYPETTFGDPKVEQGPLPDLV